MSGARRRVCPRASIHAAQPMLAAQLVRLSGTAASQARVQGLARHLLSLHSGFTPYGRTHLPEFGLTRLREQDVTAWAAEWFTRDNVAVWIAGGLDDRQLLTEECFGTHRFARQRKEVAKLSWDGERVQEHLVGPPAIIAPPAASAEVPAVRRSAPEAGRRRRAAEAWLRSPAPGSISPAVRVDECSYG